MDAWREERLLWDRVGRGRVGAAMCWGELSHLPGVFASPVQAESESTPLTFAAAAQVEMLLWISHEGDSRC